MRTGWQRITGLSLGVVLTLGAAGAPSALASDSDVESRLLREVQAELDALLAPTAAGAPLLAAGPVESPVVATSIKLTETTAEVSLDWDDPEGIGRFELLRDGDVVAEIDGPSDHLDVVDVGATYVYEVRAVDPGSGNPTVGTTAVAVSTLARGCDLTWTGAVDSEFALADNWAPIGTSPLAPRPPDAADHVCIDTRQNTPATTTAASVGVDTLSTSLPADAAQPRLFEVAGGDITIGDSLDGMDVEVSDGTLVTTGPSVFRLLDLTGGTLSLDGNSTVAGTAVFGPGSPTVASAKGTGVELSIGRATATDADITLDGPVALAGFELQLRGDSSIVPGPSAGSIITLPFLVADTGTAQVDSTVSTGTLLIVNEGAALTVTDHQAITNGVEPQQIAVGGSLTLTQPVTRLGLLDLRTATAEVTLNGATNDFADLTRIGDMTMDDAVDVIVRNDIEVASLSMNNGATFTVEGELDIVSFLSLSDATVTAPSIVSSGTGTSDGDIDVFGTANRIVGDVTTDGTIRLNSDFEVNTDARLAIDGALTLASTAESTPQLRTTVNGTDVTGRLAVRDEVVLDGLAVVSVVGSIPADVDIAAVSWGSATGDIALDLTGNTDDTTIERKAGGIIVRRDGGTAGIDVTDVAALGITVDEELGAQVSLAWPEVLDAIGYRVERVGDELVETGDTTAIVAQEPGTVATYTVFALGEEDEFELGSLVVLVPTRECSVSWTGAIDDAWGTPLNWAPIVKAGEPLPAPSAPPTGSDVCIDVDTNLPVQVDATDTDLLSVTSVLADGRVLDVESSLFDTGFRLEVPDLRVSDSLLLSGAMVVDELQMSRSEITADSVEAFRIDVVDLQVGAGDSAINAVVTAGTVDVAAGTKVAVGEFASSASTSLVVAGDLDIETELLALAGLNLVDDGTVAVGLGADNLLSGDWTIGTLTLDGVTQLQFSDSLVVTDLLTENATLDIGSVLTINGSLAAAQRNEIGAVDVVFGGSSTTRLVLDPVAGLLTDVLASGQITRGGDLLVDLASPVGGPDDVTVMFAASQVGTFDVTLIGPGADSAELVQDDERVRLVPAVAAPAFVMTGIDLGDGSSEPLLTFEWPSDPGADEYVLFRDGIEVAAVTGTKVIVPDDGARHVYELITLDRDDDPIDISDALAVVVPTRVCSVVWTGAIGDLWTEPFNWAPVVRAPDPLPAPSVPPTGSDVCIDVDTNLPVQVDATDTDLLSVTSVLTDGRVLDVESSLFDTGFRLEVPGLRVSDSLLLSGDVVVDELRMSRSEITADSIGAFRIDVIDLGVGAGDSAINAAVTAGTIDVAVDTQLTVDELAAAGSSTLVLAGSLVVESPVAALAGLNLLGDASIVIDGDLPNVLPGDWTIGTITLDGVPELAFRKSLVVGDVLTEDSALDALATLTITGSLSAGKSNEITAADVVFGSGSSTRLVLDPERSLWTEIRATGQVTRDGDLLVDLVSWRDDPELVLVDGATNFGTFDPTLIGPAADQVELVQDAANVRLVPASTGPVVPTLVLLGIDRGDGSGDPLLSFAWPPFDGAVGYRVLRGDDEVATVADTTATVSADERSIHTFVVHALDGDGARIGTVGELDVLPVATLAATVWTGAVDDDWHDPFNWAPVRSFGDPLPEPAVPGVDDFVIVAVDNHLPISVVSDASVQALVSFSEGADGIGLPDGTTVLDVDGVILAATFGVEVEGISGADATIELGDASTIRRLDLAGVADLQLRGDLDVDDATVTGSANLVPITDTVRITIGTLDVDDGFVSSEAPATVAVTDVDLANSFVGGGTQWDVDRLVASGGSNGAGFDPIALGEVTVETGSVLAVDQLVDIVETSFDVRGDLDLTEPGRALGGLTLDGPDAIVRIDGGEPNVLPGVTEIVGLELINAELAVDGELATTIIGLDDGRLVADGDIRVVQVISLGTTAVIEAPTVGLVADPDGFIPTQFIVGDTIEPSTLTVAGDLVFSPAGATSVQLDGPPDALLLDVNGTATLAGALDVNVGSAVPPGADDAFFGFDSSTGSFTLDLQGDGAASAELAQEPTSIRLRSIVPDTDRLLVLGVELGETDREPSRISFVWPRLDGAASYEVRRDGALVTEVVDPAAVVTAPADTTSTWSVVGIDDDKPVAQVGELDVYSLPNACTRLWTGAIDSEWNERRNWAPVVAAGESLPPMRVPDATDSACVLTDESLPIDVTADVAVASFVAATGVQPTWGFPTDTQVLAIDGAVFSTDLFGGMTGASVVGGTFISSLGFDITGVLAVDDADIEIDGLATIATVEASGDPSVFTSNVDGSELEIADLNVTDTVVTVDERIGVVVERAELAGGIVGGGSTFSVDDLRVVAGASGIGFSPLILDTVFVAEGASLTTELIVNQGDASFEIEGALDLTDPIARLGALSLAGPAARVSINAGRPNDLTGLDTIGVLALAGNGVGSDRPLRVDSLWLDSGEVRVAGELDTTSILSVGASLIEAATTRVRPDGIGTPGLLLGNGTGESTLNVVGDLVLDAATDSTIVLDALPTEPLLTVTGAASLDGLVDVTAEEVPGEGAEIALARWASATGTWTAELLGVDPEQAALAQREAGLFLTGRGVEECGDAPRFADMDVDGCWVEEEDGSYTADGDDNVDGVSVGALDIELDDTTVIRIDPDNGVISTTEGEDGPFAPVTVSVAVHDGREEVTRLSLGAITFPDLSFGGSLGFGLDDLLGFPIGGLPNLNLNGDGWGLGFQLDLPGVLRVGTGLNLSIGEFGIDPANLGIGDLAAVFGDLAAIADLRISWVDAQRWAIDTLGDIGPTVTGEIDFTELDGGGTLSVRNLVIEEALRIPDFDLTGVFTDTAHTWIVQQPSPSALRRIGFTYTPDGSLVASAIRLGDEAGSTDRTSVAAWGEWLDVDGIEIEWNDVEKRWAVAGRLSNPQVDITGTYVGDGDGATTAFDLSIAGAQLGPFATFDLDLVYDGTADLYTASAVIERDEEPPIEGTGQLRFDDGDLIEASLEFTTISIGELITIDDFAIGYSKEDGTFALAGTLVGADGTGNAISGVLRFDGGTLREGRLELDALAIGPVSFEELVVEFSNPDRDDRVTTATITGSVLGPVRDGTQARTPVSGSIAFADGDLTAFDLTVGVVDLGGVAQIEDITFSYERIDDDTAAVRGSGTLVTSDGATDTPVSVEFTLRDGRVVDARIEADVLSFANALRIDDLVLVDSPVTPGSCAPFDAPASAQQWQVSGTTTSGGETTDVSGCLVIDGRRLIGGELRLGSVRIAELAVIDDLHLTVFQIADVPVQGPDGEPLGITRTDLRLAATVTLTGGDPTSVTGEASFSNGGLTALEVAIPDLDLMNIVRLRDVEFSYSSGAPWDDTADTSFSLTGTVVGPNATSEFSGDLVYDAEGRVTTLQIDATDIDFGIFRINTLSFLYDASVGDDESWMLDGELTIGGRSVAVAGSATIRDGQVQNATLRIDRLVIGDLVVVDDVVLTYARDTRGGETWTGAGSLRIAGSPADVAIFLSFDADGRLVAGSVSIDRLEWSEMIVMEDVAFSYVGAPNPTRWSLAGSITIDGETSVLSGRLDLEAGRITSGEMTISNLRIGQLAHIDELALTANTGGAVTDWHADIIFANGASGSGSMRWVDGRLDSATLDLDDIEIGQVFTIADGQILYSQDAWALSATLDSDGDQTAIAGAVAFDDGRLIGGSLSADDVRFGGVTFDDLDLVVGQTVAFDGASVAIADVCGVADPGGAGDVFGLSAAVTNEGGGTASLGGRLRTVDGSITDGVACASNIQLGEILTIDEFLIQASSTVDDGRSVETWTGSVELRNPTSTADPFAGSFEWVVVEGATTRLDIEAANLRLSDLLHFQNASFSYIREPGVNRWDIAAELRREDGPNPAVSGSLELAGKRVTAANLDLQNVRFGNVLTLDSMSIDYVGRRATTSLPSENADPSAWDSIRTAGGCATSPSGSNVPSGPPTTAGAESYFSVDATITTSSGPFRAAGSIGFTDGRMSAFDVSVSCLRLGDWLSIEDLRLGYTAQQSFLVAARFVDGDDSSPDPAVRGRLDLDGGRVTGGQLNIQDVGLGAITLEELDITISQGDGGESSWALLVSITDANGDLQTAGGSVTLLDGKIIGGSLSLPDLPLLDLLPVRNINLAFSRLGEDLTLSGSARFVKGNGSSGSTVGISLDFRGGRLVGGGFNVDNFKLFNVIPLGSFSLSYDPDGPRWSGSFGTQVPGQSSSRIQAGIEVLNGKVVSGMIGFDGDNNGTVDAPNSSGEAPLSGNGSLGGLPLKGFFIRYCAEGSTAAFCAGVEGPMWDGALSIELPTDAAPSLDAEVRVIDGKFAGASMNLGFPNPGIPVFTGVFLNTIGAALEITPRLRFCGSLGATAGGPSLTVAQIDGSFTFSEEFSGIDIPAPSGPGCGLSTPVAIPDGVDPDYYRFLIEAQATLFPGNPLGIDITGSGYLDIQTRGYLGVGAAVSVGFWNDKLVVSGQVDGSVFDANNVPATNPETGQLLTGAQAQLSGRVAATVLGRDVAAADFIVNTVGWGGCAQLGSGRFSLRLGASGYWSGGTRLGCDLSRVRIFVPGTTNSASSTFLASPFAAPSFVAAPIEIDRTADTLFEVEPGQEVLGLILRSTTGTPDTIVISPDGTEYRVADDFGDDGPITVSSGLEQVFVIEEPTPGTWKVEQLPGSPVLSEVDSYLGLPAVDVQADVDAGDGGDYSFDYEFSEVPGQSVVFVERDANGAVIKVIGRSESSVNRSSELVARSELGASGSVVRLDSIEATGIRTGTLSYTSNAAGPGGEHQLVALVEQNGLPREEVVLATYQVAPATLASAPQSVTATPTSTGASVTWTPPADDGGREIVSYRISSIKGHSVTADGRERSAELPIPMMVPGEQLEVYVQAFTSRGLGATGRATITATTSSGPVYEPPPSSEPGPGSEQVIVPQVPPEPDDDAVPTPPDNGAEPPTPAPVTPTDPVDPLAPVGPLPATGGSTGPPIHVALLFLIAGLFVTFGVRLGRGGRSDVDRRETLTDQRPVLETPTAAD